MPVQHALPRIAELDGLRAIAVLAVLAYHLVPDLVPGGFMGVDLFFVLSGYLITSLLVEEERLSGPVSLIAFYGRRALRLLPPLAIAIALALALGVAFSRSALAAALFYANFEFRGSLGGLAHTWSLAVEEHFYFVWPILFLALPRHRVRLLIVVVAVAATLRLAGPLFEVSPGWIYQATPARADALAIGCIAALVPAPRRGGFVALALIVASFFFVRMQYYGLLTLGMTVFAVASATAIGGARGGVLRAGVLGYFGRRSYGLYLYHWPIFMAADRLALEPAFRWGMKIALPVLAAEASFWLVVRKALALKRRLGFDRRTIASSDRAVPASSGGE
jgi:peptidoglycan/LPS O-acetylase OafA/YrhL